MDRQESDQIRERASETAPSQLSSRFRLAFFAVVVLTLMALAVNVLLAVAADDSDQIRAVAETCSTTYKMGFGAIVALMSQQHVRD